MAIRWNRLETWLTLFVAGAGGVVLLLAGLWIYMSATATPLHPQAQGVQSTSDASPASQWAAAAERARAIIRTTLAEQNLPGVSVAVGVDGAVAWEEGFGFADIDTRATVTPATRFRIGTGSIPLTSAAVGVLLERKQLNLDEPIQAHVPEFPDKKWKLTLRQLMAHTSGLGNDSGDESPLLGTHCDRAADAFPAFASSELRFEPGTQYSFSRYSFIPVSAAIEHVTGDSLARVLRKEIFEPLGMHGTLADPSIDPVSPDRSTSYFPRFAGDPRYGPDQNRPLDFSCYSGGTMFVSTAGDLVRFALGVNSGKLLKAETVQVLQASQKLPSGEETGYGLGWDLESVTINGQSTTTVGHDGDVLGGTVSTLMVLRDRGLVVAVIANTSYADTPALAAKIAEAFSASPDHRKN